LGNGSTNARPCRGDGKLGGVDTWKDLKIWRTLHPGRLRAGTYSHHPFRKENDLNQTCMIMIQPLIFQGVLGGSPQDFRGPKNDHHGFFFPHITVRPGMIRPKERGEMGTPFLGFLREPKKGKFGRINIPKVFPGDFKL